MAPPPLDQTALLTVTVKSNYPAFEDLYLFVDLPEGLELVSGELSWNGSIQPNEQVTAIEAIIKSTKIGDNWEITATVPLLPVNGEENNARYHYYISISENSSLGQMNYPINDSPGTPPVSVTTAESQTFLLPDPAADPPTDDELSNTFYPFEPMKVMLEIPDLPALNETTQLTCKVLSRYDVSNCAIAINLPKGLSLVEGELEWNGNVRENKPTSFSAQVVFAEIGHMTIEARVFCESDTGRTGVANGDCRD
jgi:hypothetical protein